MVSLTGLLLALAASNFAVPALAQQDQQPSTSPSECYCTGIDYTNGGSYLIDGTANTNFTFTSVFEGCQDSDVIPVLVDPNGNDFACTTITSQPADTEQVSECNIMYSQMASGTWNVVIQATGFDFVVQRSFRITSGGSPNTVVVTVRFPYTVTDDCDVPTQTFYSYLQGPTTTLWNTIQRWQTNGVLTNYYQTTVYNQAYCHWP
ncbi:hypothetical protein GQ53DRAFT_638956, partial [Thozetella sp. PMI_491]